MPSRELDFGYAQNRTSHCLIPGSLLTIHGFDDYCTSIAHYGHE